MTLFLATWSAPTRGAPPAPNSPPARIHVELEAKPPDEPSSLQSAEVEEVPEAAPSSGAMPAPRGSGDKSSAPVAVDMVAHPPEIVTYVVPEYPRMARARGIEGRVLVMVIVDTSGKVEDDIKILDSIPMLDQAAVDAVRQWRFTPARDADGNAVRVQLAVPVRFTLR